MSQRDQVAAQRQTAQGDGARLDSTGLTTPGFDGQAPALAAKDLARNASSVATDTQRHVQKTSFKKDEKNEQK